MRLNGIQLNILLFSLVTTLSHPPDAGGPIANSCDLPTADEPETSMRSTAGALTIGRFMGCPSLGKHSSPPHPPAHSAPPPNRRHTARVVTAIIPLALVAWLVWRYLGSGMQKRSRGLSAHQFGRTEAVSWSTPSESDPPLHDSDSFKPQSHPGRTATVVSAGGSPCHTPPLDLPSLGESTEGLEDLVEANLQRIATPCGNAFQRLVAILCRIPETWNKLSTGRLEQTVALSPIRQRDSASLRRSLYGGPRDTFLVVGVDIPEHRDAENDAEYLRQMFESSAHCSSALRFESIQGAIATYSNVRETVLALLGEAQATPESSQTFLLFTGAGDGNNAMCLANGEVLSEADVNQWVLASPTDQTNESGIGVLFDICRTAKSPLATAPQPVEVAWSCSVGEFAYAIRISEHKLIPRSIFLLAIFLAAHDLVHNPSGCFEVAFEFHIKQLGELVRFMYHRDHQGQCSLYPTHEQCGAPRIQTPDLRQAGHIVARLGKLIATYFPQHACEVFAAVDHKMFQESFRQIFCPSSASCTNLAHKPTIKDES